MRLSEISVGMMVAVPCDRIDYPITGARDGRVGIPARVLAIGKFRYSRATNCDASVIEEGGFRQMVKISVLDVLQYDWSQRRDLFPRRLYPLDGIGMPKGTKLSSKKLQWVDRLIDPRNIGMPWDIFVQEVQERWIAKDEMSVYETLLGEKKEALADRAKEVLPEISRYVRDRGGWMFSTDGDGQVVMRITVSVPAEQVDATLAGEVAELDRKMKCPT